VGAVRHDSLVTSEAGCMPGGNGDWAWLAVPNSHLVTDNFLEERV